MLVALFAVVALALQEAVAELMSKLEQMVEQAPFELQPFSIYIRLFVKGVVK
jgi:hypothetical protein